MRVQTLMVKNPITINTSASIEKAISLMKKNRIRHLPVVDDLKILKGFLTLADLKEGLMPSMVVDISLKDLIIEDPITVSPDDDIETAAKKIYRHKISGMPVVDSKKLVGIITETDILRTFIDMLGILSAGSEIEILLPDTPEAFNESIEIIHENCDEIISIIVTGQQKSKRAYHVRLSPCDIHSVKSALEARGITVLNSSSR